MPELSYAQQRILREMADGKLHTPYEMCCSDSTMRVLEWNGLIESQAQQIGYLCASHLIRWRIKQAGEVAPYA